MPGLQRTRDFVFWHECRCILSNKLRLVLASIAKYLDDTGSVPSDLFIEFEPLGHGLLGGTDENEANHNAILNALGAALSLVYRC